MPLEPPRTAISQPVERGLRGTAAGPSRAASGTVHNVTYPRCMHALGRPRARRPWLPIIGAAIAVAALCALAAWRPWVVAAPPVAIAAAPAVEAIAPAPLTLPV